MTPMVVRGIEALAREANGRSLIAVDGRMAAGKTTLGRQLAELVSGTMIQTDCFIESQWGRDTRSIVYADVLDLKALDVRIRNARERGPVVLDGICIGDTIQRLGVAADLHVLVTFMLPGTSRFCIGRDPVMQERLGPSGVHDAALLDEDVTESQLMVELRKDWGPHDLFNERSLVAYFKRSKPHRVADVLYLRT